MSARDDQARAYAGDPGADYTPEHGGPVTTDDVAAAFAAGWDACAAQIRADVT